MSRIAAMSDYLLALYQRAGEDSADRHSTFALGGLCGLLGADKAWWGLLRFQDEGPRLLSSFRAGLPDSWDSTWEAVKCDDSVARTIAAARRRSMTLDAAAIPASSGLRRLAEAFDLGHTLSIAVDMPEPSTFMFVSLYRGHGQKAFSREDRDMNQSMAPHLHAAWRQNLRERLRDPSHASTDAPPPQAFMDRDGRLVQHDSAFSAQVARRWPAWRGDVLPGALHEAARRARDLPERWLSVGNSFLRARPAGLLTLLELREPSRLDCLSGRQREVARHFSEGATHKEIAKSTGLAPSTVRHYIQEAYARLGVDNKASLAALVLADAASHRASDLADPR